MAIPISENRTDPRIDIALNSLVSQDSTTVFFLPGDPRLMSGSSGVSGRLVMPLEEDSDDFEDGGVWYGAPPPPPPPLEGGAVASRLSKDDGIDLGLLGSSDLSGFSGRVFLTLIWADIRSRVISPVSGSMMSTQSLRLDSFKWPLWEKGRRDKLAIASFLLKFRCKP